MLARFSWTDLPAPPSITHSQHGSAFCPPSPMQASDRTAQMENKSKKIGGSPKHSLVHDIPRHGVTSAPLSAQIADGAPWDALLPSRCILLRRKVHRTCALRRILAPTNQLVATRERAGRAARTVANRAAPAGRVVDGAPGSPSHAGADILPHSRPSASEDAQAEGGSAGSSGHAPSTSTASSRVHFRGFVEGLWLCALFGHADRPPSVLGAHRGMCDASAAC